MIKIICIGKIKEKYLTDGINDYLKRLTKYHKIELIELKDSDIKKEKEEIGDVLAYIHGNSEELTEKAVIDLRNVYEIEKNN